MPINLWYLGAAIAGGAVITHFAFPAVEKEMAAYFGFGALVYGSKPWQPRWENDGTGPVWVMENWDGYVLIPKFWDQRKGYAQFWNWTSIMPDGTIVYPALADAFYGKTIFLKNPSEPNVFRCTIRPHDAPPDFVQFVAQQKGVSQNTQNYGIDLNAVKAKEEQNIQESLKKLTTDGRMQDAAKTQGEILRAAGMSIEELGKGFAGVAGAVANAGKK